MYKAVLKASNHYCSPENSNFRMSNLSVLYFFFPSFFPCLLLSLTEVQGKEISFAYSITRKKLILHMLCMFKTKFSEMLFQDISNILHFKGFSKMLSHSVLLFYFTLEKKVLNQEIVKKYFYGLQVLLVKKLLQLPL
jgi:hypothetical protein